jgi:hypothetical protein
VQMPKKMVRPHAPRLILQSSRRFHDSRRLEMATRPPVTPLTSHLTHALLYRATSSLDMGPMAVPSNGAYFGVEVGSTPP